jgi:hypothetical protein
MMIMIPTSFITSLLDIYSALNDRHPEPSVLNDHHPEPNTSNELYRALIKRKRVSRKVLRLNKSAMLNVKYVVFTAEQKKYLKALFDRIQYITRLGATTIFNHLQEMPKSNARLTIDHVITWFTNRRTRSRKNTL